MKKFEVGKRYYESGLTFEIISKTEKTITTSVIQHSGRCNERIIETKKIKLRNWIDREVFYYHSRTVEA